MASISMNPLPFSDLDDDGFLLTLYEFQNGSITYNQDRLGTLFFNPLLLNTRHHLALNSNLDPDENFLGICSISQNKSRLTDWLCGLDIKFPVVGITETWQALTVTILFIIIEEIELVAVWEFIYQTNCILKAVLI
jgi:hypothetical protein